MIDSSPKAGPSSRQLRGIWWFIGVIAAGSFVLQSIKWSRGQHSLPDLLTSAGLMMVSAGSLSHRPTPRLILLLLGTLALLDSIWLRYFYVP